MKTTNLAAQTPPSNLAEVTVDPMLAEEKTAVKQLVDRSFPFFQRLFFSWTPNILVAKHEGKLVGAVVLKIYPLSNGKKGGCITWIFTDPQARGIGAGQHLVEAAIEFFEAQDCAEMTACVEGYNVSSSKLFSNRGFTILAPGQQIQRYGLRLLPTWYYTFHLFDIGHFMWAKPGAEHADRSVWQWWGTLLINALITLFLVWRGGNLAPIVFAAIPILYFIILGARSWAMKWTASSLDVAVRFRTWETGFLVSFFIALIIGGLFPIPGGIYSVSDQWRYREMLPKLGKIALAGVFPTLFITFVCWTLLRFSDLSAALQNWMDLTFFISVNLALFDIVLIFFHFTSFNGRRIFDWNPFIWSILAILTLMTLFF